MPDQPVDLNALRAQLVGGRPPARPRARVVRAPGVRPPLPPVALPRPGQPGPLLRMIILAVMGLLSLVAISHALRMVNSWMPSWPFASKSSTAAARKPVAPVTLPRPRPAPPVAPHPAPVTPSASPVERSEPLHSPEEALAEGDTGMLREPAYASTRSFDPVPVLPERLAPQPPRLLRGLSVPTPIRGFLAPYRGSSVVFIVTVDPDGRALAVRPVLSGARVPGGALRWLARELAEARWAPATGEAGEPITGTAVVAIAL